jgi:hypothetical protein
MDGEKDSALMARLRGCPKFTACSELSMPLNTGLKRSTAKALKIFLQKTIRIPQD